VALRHLLSKDPEVGATRRCPGRCGLCGHPGAPR
jgi:hypothetical protein